MTTLLLTCLGLGGCDRPDPGAGIAIALEAQGKLLEAATAYEQLCVGTPAPARCSAAKQRALRKRPP